MWWFHAIEITTSSAKYHALYDWLYMWNIYNAQYRKTDRVNNIFWALTNVGSLNVDCIQKNFFFYEKNKIILQRGFPKSLSMLINTQNFIPKTDCYSGIWIRSQRCPFLGREGLESIHSTLECLETLWPFNDICAHWCGTVIGGAGCENTIFNQKLAQGHS